MSRSSHMEQNLNLIIVLSLILLLSTFIIGIITNYGVKQVSADSSSTTNIDLFSLSCSDLQQLVNKLLIPIYYYGFNSGDSNRSMQLVNIYLHMMDGKGCKY